MTGRPTKQGLDYFELDCHMDDKVKLIQAEFGLKGFAVVVKLYQKIYSGNGYYCEWNEDVLLLFMAENGLSSDSRKQIDEIVSACIRRDIFSETLFIKYGILTSCGVQKRYLKATTRRDSVDLKKEYLLISIPKNTINVAINSINADRNSQSKEKESKEYCENTLCKADALTLFERLWELYPNKKGKGKVSDSKKMKLLEIGFEEMERAIYRYKVELKKDADWRKPQNGGTFFNSGYLDYLDANYVPSQVGSGNNRFNQMQQNDYDFDSLERELLSN